MTTSINVDKRSVKQLLETGKNKRFIIPEYQRPYAWSDEQIQVLFDDLTEYTLNTTEDENNTYFLGTIVSYENDNKEQDAVLTEEELDVLNKLNKLTTIGLTNNENKKLITHPKHLKFLKVM